MDQRVKWDYNGLSIVDREHYTYVRGLARNFIEWLGCTYEVIDPKGGPVLFEPNFAGRYLMDQACAILKYKRRAEKEGLAGPRHCTAEAVERQLDYLFGKEPSWCGNWMERKVNIEDSTTLGFTNQSFVVRKKLEPLPFDGELHAHLS